MQLRLIALLPAAPQNPNTDWFQKAGYGVFVQHVRLSAVKPEGLNQKGGQMSVVELEVYE